MSTSLLYHAFGSRGYPYRRADSEDGRVVFAIRQEPETCHCPACGSSRVRMRGTVERSFCVVPIGSRSTIVVLPIPRVECRSRGVVRQFAVPFADPRRSSTRAFERYALELSRRYARPKLKHLRHIAIDEIAVAKGHRYLTVVIDLDGGAVVSVGDGKRADALKPFWKRLRPSGARIDAVAMDMSSAYRRAVAAHLPKAKIVFDHLHIVKLFNEKLSDLRRPLHRWATDVIHVVVFNGTRWLLLKSPENIDARKDERQRLEEALALNTPLATAYSLK